MLIQTITKQFDLCYGHRVWSQELNADYSIDCSCACRHLHGHQGTILVSLRRPGDELVNGMITDFKHLNWFKVFVDDVLDHKMILDINDPLITNGTMFPELGEALIDSFVAYHPEDYITFKEEYVGTLATQCVRELYEGMVFVNFVPTSENLSRWLHKIVNDKMKKIGVECSGVTFFETPKSQTTLIAL